MKIDAIWNSVPLPEPPKENWGSDKVLYAVTFNRISTDQIILGCKFGPETYEPKGEYVPRYRTYDLDALVNFWRKAHPEE